ncbi:hypothetical protein AVEN_26297-1 [Araneus ventricosus]|uniref:Uncharacterized protein n=1 Tax=Araneus ventricosus TaxID=182803 RepID=A0A4Y2ANM8_ARAVE|nr:hypothetical protein AVEN_26297-1 [Araneus ventricosus]
MSFFTFSLYGDFSMMANTHPNVKDIYQRMQINIIENQNKKVIEFQNCHRFVMLGNDHFLYSVLAFKASMDFKSMRYYLSVKKKRNYQEVMDRDCWCGLHPLSFGGVVGWKVLSGLDPLREER